MRIFKPSWVHHGGGGIYSLDVSGDKLLTGGAFESASGLVAVWRLAPILNGEPTAPPPSTASRQLCRLEFTACVNCVRWAPIGERFAAGGDDKRITIWQLQGSVESSGSIGSSSVEQGGKKELYRSIATLAAHTGDVLHVEWSRDGRFLASCSVDNTVIVWNAINLSFVATLRGHTDFVKGLSWDPVGSFLATQSSDKTVKLWAVHKDWQCVRTVTEPFQETGGTTTVTRLDWSPCGRFLLSAHSMNNGGPTATIIRRRTNDSNDHDQNRTDLVGHRKGVACVKWSGVVFEPAGGVGLKSAALVACGSRDRSLSVWQVPRCHPRPLAVIDNLFELSVLDLCWTPDGLSLLSCSLDGTTAVIRFDPSEIGTAWSEGQLDRFVQKEYGKSLPSVRPLADQNSVALGSPSSRRLVENAELVSARMQLKNDVSVENRPPSQTAITVITKDTTNAKETQMKEQSDASNKSSSERQIETKRDDGKRRIKPIFLGSTIVTPTTTTSTGLPASKPIVEQQTNTAVANTTTANESATIRMDISESPMSERKRDLTTTDAPLIVKRKRKREPPVVPTNTVHLSHSMPVTRAPLGAAEYGLGGFALPVPNRQHSLMLELEENGQSRRVQVENGFSPNPPGVASGSVSRGVCRVALVNADTNRDQQPTASLSVLRPIWQALFPETDAISLAVTPGDYVALAFEDASLRVLCLLSGRLFFTLQLNGRISALKTNGRFLMAVTEHTFCYVWDIRSRKALLSERSLAPLISDVDGVSICSESVTDNGAPVIALSDGRAFTFSHDLQAWQLVVNGSSSNQLSSVVRSPKLQQRPLAALLSMTAKSVTPSVGHRHQWYLSSLESHLQACVALRSADEYRHWLQRYVNLLVTSGEEVRLDALLGELLEGDVREGTACQLLGLNSVPLLEELLPLLAVNTTMQKLFTRFRDAVLRRKAQPKDGGHTKDAFRL